MDTNQTSPTSSPFNETIEEEAHRLLDLQMPIYWAVSYNAMWTILMGEPLQVELLHNAYNLDNAPER